ncbi:hypothetical protein Tco_1193933 [Tanacetum coccineum]
MDLKNYKEGQSMKRPPLFEANYFIYWKNQFETYVKSKDIELWHIIVYGDHKPSIKNKDTEKDEVIPYEKFEESHKKIISKIDEAKMLLYNALPKKEYERIFMKFLRALHTKWRPKVTAIEESKDLSTLPLDELIGKLKVYEVVLEKDSEASKIKKEKYKSLALKARKISNDEEESCSSSDEEYAMTVRDFKKFFRRREKFVRQPYDDKKKLRKVKDEKKGKEDRRFFNEDGDNSKDEICLMALDNNENKLERLEKNKEISVECESCVKFNSKNESLSLKLARFENGSHFLQEMIENQRTQKDKKGLDSQRI